MVTEQSTDVEMKDSDSPKTETESGEENKKDGEAVHLEEFREQWRQLEKGVGSKEPRFILRVLRGLPSTRKKLTPSLLRKLLTGFYTHSAADRDKLMAYVEEPMEVETSTEKGKEFRPRTGKAASQPLLPEMDAYLHLLILISVIDLKKYPLAQQCADELMQKICAQNRRSLDLIAAKCYFYYARSYELQGALHKIRGFLHNRLRTATLRNDFEGQAVLINCLLRNYLSYNLYDQADRLVSRCTFPETASNNEWARFLYYLGRIKATQLEYSAARTHLLQAMRKAPQHTAVGFKQTVQKLSIIVELLLGDIPERQTFLQATMRRALQPYFQLTHAVLLGNLARFGEVVESWTSQFKTDHTLTLILRLRHNVIKTAIRIISLSYSRISLQDVAKKLLLDSAEDAEYIVAKAIRDGVIEATLDHENQCMRSREMDDIYCTREPQHAFHQRISFCLHTHNQSVKALRFPPKHYSQDLESAEERREREQQDLELAKEMAEEDEDSFP